jgi:hypothetical protein
MYSTSFQTESRIERYLSEYMLALLAKQSVVRFLPNHALRMGRLGVEGNKVITLEERALLLLYRYTAKPKSEHATKMTRR